MKNIELILQEVMGENKANYLDAAADRLEI